jgi:hypothetical protein
VDASLATSEPPQAMTAERRSKRRVLQAFSGPASALLFTRSWIRRATWCCERKQGFTRHGLPSFRCNAPLTDCLMELAATRCTVSVLTLRAG